MGHQSFSSKNFKIIGGYADARFLMGRWMDRWAYEKVETISLVSIDHVEGQQNVGRGTTKCRV